MADYVLPEEKVRDVVIDLKPAILRWQYLNGEELSMSDLAEAVGVSTATLYRLREGKTLQPDLRILARIAAFLGCNVRDLFRYEDEVDQPLVLALEGR